PGARRRGAGVPLPGREALRLRGLGRNDPALPRARRRGRAARRAHHPARPLRHAAGLDAGPGLVRRGALGVSDPVSWLLVEPGWEVVDAGGESVGKVHEVLGDKDRDIFDGLQVTSGVLAESRYVPAEEGGTITEGRVQLTAR